MGPLLAFLAAAALAGASTIPVEKDHTEEMVTRCIVEVLANALSKANAAPINPECKDILRRSDKNDRERSENQQPKGPAETQKHPAGSVEKEQRQAGEEPGKVLEGGEEEELAHEEGKSEEDEEAGHHPPGQEETLHTEEKKHYQEMGREEERNYLRAEESQEGRCCEEVEAAVVTKKSHSEAMGMEELRGGKGQSPRESWHPEEGHTGEGQEGQGRSEQHQESQERGFSHQQQQPEESEEREEGKEPHKAKGFHGRHRAGGSYEEKRGETAGDSQPGQPNLWEQWKHQQKLQEEAEDKGGELERPAELGSEEEHRDSWDKGNKRHQHSEELRDSWEGENKRHQHSEELRDSWQQSQESRERENRRHQHSEESRDSWEKENRKHQHSEELMDSWDKENKRHQHSEESSEKWHEERRHHDGSQHSEGRLDLAEGSEEGLGWSLGPGRSLGKERQRPAGGRAHPRDKEGEGSHREHKGQARRQQSTEHSLEQEMVLEKKHHSSDQVDSEEEERFAEREEYRGPAEKEKRTAAAYRPFYPLLWWKSRHLDKRDSAGEQLLQEEGTALSDRSLFPEYSDYEWWPEKQVQSALKHRGSEKRNPGRTNRYDVERQYNKMDQLAQLLNYRKKSAELPELYSSGEDLRKRQGAGSDRRSLSQRPLTEEEEKQLENLATMDLELQNIAERINSLRRG